MKLKVSLALTAACASVCLFAGASAAQPHTGASMPAASAPAAKFSVDTPIQDLVADPRAKAVLDKHFPGIEQHEHYPLFKDKSLREIAPNTGGALTDEVLDKINAELAQIG